MHCSTLIREASFCSARQFTERLTAGQFAENKYFESRMSLPQPSCHSSGIYVEERERRLEKSEVEGNFTATAFQSLFGRGTHELTMTVTVIVTALTRLAQVPDSPNPSMEESR